MKLGKKKELAARTLNVGKARVVFVNSRTKEIKEAITKQDIRDLVIDKAILVKEVKGRKKKVAVKRKSRSPGNVKKKVNNRKELYMILTRKLRKYVKGLKSQGKLSKEQTEEIRKKIRNKAFKSLAHLKDYIGGLNK
jgi:large subunit ribosomal protein L19e